MQDYFAHRECLPQAADYWEPRADPDGKIRDRTTEEERLQFVADVQYIVDGINSELPDTVLDYGAGLGWLLEQIDASHKYAVETSEVARRFLRALGVKVSSVELMEEDSMDAVICHHVIEHVADPLYLVSQLRRVLRRGGTLVLATPDFGCPCAVRFGPNYRMLHDPTHCSLFTLESCSRMLRDYGFTIERIDYPFPERYATTETMQRWRNADGVSPPWPGNWMTFWCTR